MSTLFFFFNDTATTEIYTLSLHDALPICGVRARSDADSMCTLQLVHEVSRFPAPRRCAGLRRCGDRALRDHRSEEHTSELQSQSNLVCRLLLEKKKECRRCNSFCNQQPTR